jgi:nitrite reductase (NADH) small subunit
MSELHWIWLTEVGNVPQREGRLVEIGGRQLAVFNLGGRFVAIDNRCPHKGGPLADGIVAGDSVVCPLHGWKVNLQDGSVGRPAGTEACVTSYPTRVDAGVIVVGVPSTFLTNNDGKAA